MTEANGGSRPVPDPTVLTDKALERLDAAIRDRTANQLAIRDERLNGIDKAVVLSFESLVAARQAIIDKVAGLDRVVGVMFEGVQTQFTDRDTLAQRESALNKIALDAAFSASKEAVAAAFAAQKEDANRRDEANGKAIDKSEKATTETIKTNQELNKATTDALTKTLDEVKLQVSRIESIRVGGQESRAGLIALVGLIGTVLGIVIAVTTVLAILKP